MTAVLYLRYSSDKQTEQSIEGQRKVCEEYAQRNGISVLREYVDRATSASKNIEKRLAFLDMIKDAQAKEFDTVLVYRLDRFSRDMYEDAIYKHRLKQYGVKVVSATENIPDDPSGIILASLISGMNQYYSAELSQKVKRGMRVSMEKCQWHGGRIPLGYTIIDKKYALDPKTAPHVARVFEMYAEGLPLREVHAYLGSVGIFDKTGKPITEGTLCNMLKNKVYAGYYISKSQGIEQEGGVPALVSQEVFDRVQARIGLARKQSRLGTGTVHAKGLIGKMFCGECGDRIKGTSVRKKNDQRFFYLLCVNKCTGYLNRDEIEDAVFRDIQQWFTEDKIEGLAVRVVELYKAQSDNQKAIDEAQSQIQALNKKLVKFINLYAEEGIEAAKEQAKATDNEIKTLEKYVDRLKLQSSEVDASKIIKFIKSALTEDTDAPRFRQRMFDILVNKVVIYKNKIEVYYNLDETKGTLELPTEGGSNMPGSGDPYGGIIELNKIFYLYSMICTK